MDCRKSVGQSNTIYIYYNCHPRWIRNNVWNHMYQFHFNIVTGVSILPVYRPTYLNATRTKVEIEENFDSRWIVSVSAASDKSSRTFGTWEHRVCRPSWINPGSDTSSTTRSTTLHWWEGGWVKCKWREGDRDYRPWTIDNENKMCYSLNPCNHKGSLNYILFLLITFLFYDPYMFIVYTLGFLLILRQKTQTVVSSGH